MVAVSTPCLQWSWQELHFRESENEVLKKRLATETEWQGYHLCVEGESWQYMGASGEWMPYPAGANEKLLVAYMDKEDKCEIFVDDRAYEIHFASRTQRNLRTHTTRSIRFFPDLPEHWKMTENEALWLMEQAPGIQGYFDSVTKKVSDPVILHSLEVVLNGSLLRHDGSPCFCPHGEPTYKVKEAFQVRNHALWRNYQARSRRIADQNRELGIRLEEMKPPVGDALAKFGEELLVEWGQNEELLFHGTRTWEDAKNIVCQGFDNRVANDSGLYGRGTYFATQTCKSAQYATTEGHAKKASDQMVGTLLLARVAVGDPYYASGPYQDSRLSPAQASEMYADGICLVTLFGWFVSSCLHQALDVSALNGLVSCFEHHIGLHIFRVREGWMSFGL